MHEKELEDLTNRIDNDRNRQRALLQERLREKRRQKTMANRRKQEVDLTREMIQQDKELNEVRVKVVRSLKRYEIHGWVEKLYQK